MLRDFSHVQPIAACKCQNTQNFLFVIQYVFVVGRGTFSFLPLSQLSVEARQVAFDL